MEHVRELLLRRGLSLYEGGPRIALSWGHRSQLLRGERCLLRKTREDILRAQKRSLTGVRHGSRRSLPKKKAVN